MHKSMADNLSFVLRGVGDVVYEQRPIPEISDNEILVEVKKTGICGSDVHYLVHGRIGDFVVESPMVLGHESSGIVSKVGAKVKTHKAGDRVAIEPGATCLVCDSCRSGKYELCPNIVFAATPPYDGTLARYYRVPAQNAYHLPENLTLEDGAMMEPLAVAVHSVANLGGFRANQSVVIFGCGPVGLLCMAVAKALGGSRIIAVDILPDRLEIAKSYAATQVFRPPPLKEGEPKLEYSKRSANAMKEVLGIEERGVKAIDLVVDASGAEASVQTALAIVKSGGTHVQVGMGHPAVTIDMSAVLPKELTIKGSFRYGFGDYPLAIDLAAQGKVDLKTLVTHRYSFEDAELAFKATREGKSEDGKGVIKVMISGPEVHIGRMD
jgi:D-xylulose reductase